MKRRKYRRYTENEKTKLVTEAMETSARAVSLKRGVPYATMLNIMKTTKPAAQPAAEFSAVSGSVSAPTLISVSMIDLQRQVSELHSRYQTERSRVEKLATENKALKELVQIYFQ